MGKESIMPFIQSKQIYDLEALLLLDWSETSSLFDSI
jgi:hypothetical protein